jgi:small multidrug resistance pump
VKPWLILAVAIVCEVTATSALKASAGLTKLPWVGVVVVGYAGAFALLAWALKYLSVGAAYATWSGIGTIGAAAVGALAFKEALGLPQAMGIALIIAGVAVLNLSGSGH